MKDWTGNSNSVFKTIGASNHSDTERDKFDFYATDPVAIDALLAYPNVKLPNNIWEPSCGMGNLSERLKKSSYNVYSSDIIDRGYGNDCKNFFDVYDMPKDCSCIITNPPYKFAAEYVIHALKILPEEGLLCLFLKTTFAEGHRRYADIFSHTPPIYVLQCVERVLCAKYADFDKQKDSVTSAVSYAWWIWIKGYKGQTTLDWINYTPTKNKRCEWPSIFEKTTTSKF